MDEGSAAHALDRIEAALARINKAESVPPADEGLRERHERLRLAASDALQRLDALVAAPPPQPSPPEE